MNTEAQELVKQYIQETLKEGITPEAFSLLELMMRTDRNLASQLHEIYDQSVSSGNKYYIQED